VHVVEIKLRCTCREKGKSELSEQGKQTKEANKPVLDLCRRGAWAADGAVQE